MMLHDGRVQDHQDHQRTGSYAPGKRKSMPKKSATARTVRKSARELPPASNADLDRLRAAQQGRIDTSDIPERRKLQPLQRDASGRLPRKSMIREAVARQMRRQDLTVYRLWQLARAHYPTL